MVIILRSIAFKSNSSLVAIVALYILPVLLTLPSGERDGIIKSTQAHSTTRSLVLKQVHPGAD